jgi:hypothetical protein
MNNQDYQMTQEIWTNINALAAVAATPNMDAATVEYINVQIRDLMRMLKPYYTKLSAASAGLLTSTLT